jgi:hypothetical protein
MLKFVMWYLNYPITAWLIMLARQEVEQPGQAQRLLVLRAVVLQVVSQHLGQI